MSHIEPCSVFISPPIDHGVYGRDGIGIAYGSYATYQLFGQEHDIDGLRLGCIVMEYAEGDVFGMFTLHPTSDSIQSAAF